MASRLGNGAESQEVAAPTQHGPPYQPKTQLLGQIPAVLPDIPVNVVFLVLFIAACAAHGILFRNNLRDGKKFPISAVTSVFCFTRILATILRIAWACHPTNIHLGITATVFVNGGIVLLLMVNLVFAQRLVRAQHPRFGWATPFSIAVLIVVGVAVVAVLCLVIAVIVSFYSKGSATFSAALAARRFGSTLLAIVALLPLPVVGASSIARMHYKKTQTIDKFGEGSMRTKVAIVLVSATVLSLGAWFRAGTILAHPVPVILQFDPPKPAPVPGYLSKGCFYVFNFTLEILICIFWLAIRVDRRFRIPDGAKGPFSYAGGFVFAGETGNQKRRVSVARPSSQTKTESITAPTRESRRSSRISVSSRQSRQLEDLKERISWGGVSHDAIAPAVAEDGVHPIPYEVAPEQSAADGVGIDGIERELGFDPKSGRWAVRPVSGADHTAGRPTSMVSSV